MKIQIYRMDDENIFCGKDYSNIKDKGEIAHILMELELIKMDLIELWCEYDENE